jgi:hypothetical protein
MVMLVLHVQYQLVILMLLLAQMALVAYVTDLIQLVIGIVMITCVVFALPIKFGLVLVNLVQQEAMLLLRNGYVTVIISHVALKILSSIATMVHAGCVRLVPYVTALLLGSVKTAMLKKTTTAAS